jgi:hypothetical protein
MKRKITLFAFPAFGGITAEPERSNTPRTEGSATSMDGDSSPESAIPPNPIEQRASISLREHKRVGSEECDMGLKIQGIVRH